MVKKNKLLFLLIITLITILSACGGSGNDSPDNDSVVGDDIEGATELLYWTFADQHMLLFEDGVERWNEEYPDRPIKLVSEVYPFDQMHNNLLLALQSEKGAPDLADIELNRFPNFLQGEPQLEAMNEYVEPEIDNFIRSRFDIYGDDENFYGMPTHVGATVMYYNMEIMDEAGVDIDTIVTWDDYIEAGKKVIENTDAVMSTVDTTGYSTYWPLISQQGSDFFDEDGELILDNQINIDTLQFLHDLVYEHKISELTPGGENSAEEFYGYMNDGGAATVAMPMWYMPNFTEQMPDLKGKIEIRPLPVFEEGNNRSAGMGGTGTVVTNQSEETELAKDFLAFVKLSKEGNVKLWEILGFDPPRWDVWDSPEMEEDNIYYQYFGDDIFNTLLDVRDEIGSLNVTPGIPDVDNELTTNVLNNVLRNQSQSPEEALTEAVENIKNK